MLQSYKYGFLTAIGNRSAMFWTLAFPIILGTFFNIAFGSIISNTESFSEIPVAIVTDVTTSGDNNSEEVKSFLTMIESLSQGDDALLTPQYMDYEYMENAKNLLSKGDIDGIFYVNKVNKINKTEDDSQNIGIELTVFKQGLNQSILKSISDSYLRISGTVNNIARTRPDMIEQTIANLSGEIKINKEIYLGRGETDTMIQYFYALIAMTCLYGCFFGYTKVAGIQANMSPLAARRCISPSKKITMILSDFAAAVTVQFLETLIVIAYLAFVLGVNFGEQWLFVILTSLVGSIMGVSFGMFLTSFLKGGENMMMGILSSATLFLSFLSGLMIGTMKYAIERTAPIINRINPAALLSDAFYVLTVYDTYSRYIICMVSMLIISAVFCIASAFVLRRKKYVNI